MRIINIKNNFAKIFLIGTKVFLVLFPKVKSRSCKNEC